MINVGDFALLNHGYWGLNYCENVYVVCFSKIENRKDPPHYYNYRIIDSNVNGFSVGNNIALFQSEYIKIIDPKEINRLNKLMVFQ